MKLVARQGDVHIFEVEEFPIETRFLDEQCKNGELAYGEAHGHSHAIAEADLDAATVFKIATQKYKDNMFIETKKSPVRLVHGRQKGFTGVETDTDYHNIVVLDPGKKYITGIVEETDWINKISRKVLD